MADRTPDEIEREIEAEREALTQSLDALQRQLSPDVLIDRAMAKLRERGGTVAETALRQARENPMAMAVTGLGLAWLAAGPATSRRRALRLPPPSSDPGSGLAPLLRRNRLADDMPSDRTSPDDRIASAPRSATMQGRTQDRTLSGPTAPRPSPAFDDRTYERTPGFREANDPMRGFDDRLARASGDATDPTVKERLGNAMASAKEKLMSLKTRLADAAHDPKTTARELRAYLSEGTEQMSETTRERVIAARRAAWEAEKRLEAHARDYADAGREFYGNQPLVGGLVAFGLGAAIGAALPRTRQENRYLGAYRDRAMEEGERLYRSESDKLRGVAERAVEDAKQKANEALDNVAADAKSATSSAEDKLETELDKAGSATTGSATTGSAMTGSTTTGSATTGSAMTGSTTGSATKESGATGSAAKGSTTTGDKTATAERGPKAL